jgi:hypothetical protein
MATPTAWKILPQLPLLRLQILRHLAFMYCDMKLQYSAAGISQDYHDKSNLEPAIIADHGYRNMAYSLLVGNIEKKRRICPPVTILRNVVVKVISGILRWTYAAFGYDNIYRKNERWAWSNRK